MLCLQSPAAASRSQAACYVCYQKTQELGTPCMCIVKAETSSKQICNIVLAEPNNSKQEPSSIGFRVELYEATYDLVMTHKAQNSAAVVCHCACRAQQQQTKGNRHHTAGLAEQTAIGKQVTAGHTGQGFCKTGGPQRACCDKALK